MKLKWGKEKMYRISKEVPKAERNDWAWWALFAMLVMMIVIFIIKVKG